MPYVRRYKDLNTDLDALYKDIIKELKNTKELNIGTELTGEVNGIPFKSLTATRSSIPRAVVGALRDVTVTITGTPNDYLIELSTSSWLSNMIVPGTGAFLLAGPLGGLAAAGTTTLLGVNYQRNLNNKIKELVKKNSKKKYDADKVETFID